MSRFPTYAEQHPEPLAVIAELGKLTELDAQLYSFAVSLFA